MAAGEPVADILVRNSGQLRGCTIAGDLIPRLIDEIPILAVFGTQLEGGLEIREAEELRVKESDRIKTVVENLRRMGATVEEFPDGLRVEKSNAYTSLPLKLKVGEYRKLCPPLIKTVPLEGA